MSGEGRLGVKARAFRWVFWPTLLGTLIAAALSPAPIRAATTVEGDYWWGLGGAAYTLQSDQLFGFQHTRIWAATGQDGCPPCWTDSFLRLDTAFGDSGFSLFIGAEVLSRQSGALSESHAGPYAGARGHVVLSPSLRLSWEASLAPYGLASTPTGAGLGETGYEWFLGTIADLSPSMSVTAGYLQMFQWLPTNAGGGTRSWEGPTAGLNIRF